MAWLQTAADVVGATNERRLYVVLPVLLILFMIAAILGVLALVPAISPFVYPLL